MKFKKAMALALAGTLVLTTVVTGTTSEAAKKTKTKLKTKKVSVFVKESKKISIKGTKEKHKYTFKSKDKKIAKVSKKGKITGVKAGKTTITVKDTWKQGGKKKSKTLGKVKVTVKPKEKKVVPKDTPAVTTQATALPTQAPAVTPTPNNGGNQPGVSSAPGTSSKPGTSSAPGTSSKPGTSSTPGTSSKPGTSSTPDIKAPTAEMKFTPTKIKVEETTTAEVTVSAGNVTAVTWTVDDAATATVKKDDADPKKAVVTGVKEGEVKVTAEVKVTVEGKEFSVKAEGKISVLAKDALVINATIESAPTELEITKSAEMYVEVDAGDEEGVAIENIEWKITKGDAAAIVESESIEKSHVIINAEKIGEVTLSVTVTAKKGDKTATDTKEVTIQVTPLTYQIGKEITCTGEDWGIAELDEGIQVKKTDLVEVVFSVKSGSNVDTTTAVRLVLSPKLLEDVASNPHRVQEAGVLRMEDDSAGMTAGTAKMVRNDTYFTNNFAAIKSVAANLADTSDDPVVVTIEKILVTPTDELAYSLHVPGGVEKDKTATIEVEIDEADFTSIEWASKDETKATVAADPEDQRNGIVTGVGAGEVEITIKIKKGDTVIKEETVSLEVRAGYKNTPIKMDLGKAVAAGKGKITKNADGSITIADEDVSVVFALPYPLKTGEKIKVSIKGSLAENSAGFRMYTTPKDDNTTGGSNIYTDLSENNPNLVKGAFEKTDIELTTTRDSANLIFRISGWSGPATIINGVTVTELTVEYI